VTLIRDYDQLFVDGQWIDVPDGMPTAVVNPATEARLAEVVEGTKTETERALAAARTAFDDGPWPRLSPARRSEYISALAAAIEARADDLRDLIVAETGSTRGLVDAMHLGSPRRFIPFFAEYARRDPITPLPPSIVGRPGGGKLLGQTVKVREPVGVVSAITPFNFPFLLNLAKVAPALAMGNTIVLKPSPYTPLEALVLGDLAQAIDLPPGVLNIITGGVEVGELLTTDPRVDMVSFTGSDTVGALVAAQAAPSLKRVVLELGGKSALILRHDANLDAAVPTGLFHFIAQAGQGCALCTRHLVHNSIKAEYLERLVTAARAVKVGDPASGDTGMGPLIREQQRARVERYVEMGIQGGGTVVTGGQRPAHLDKGYFYEPTVFVDVDNQAPIAREEIFGPVGVVIGFDDDDEAVRLANDSPYGLAGGIFSKDSGTAFEMALRIRTGLFSINGGAGQTSVHAPVGGYKRSGLGRELGEEGALEYTQVKSIGFNAG
jgi:aldehyde dehydrogenase (NAD+)